MVLEVLKYILIVLGIVIIGAFIIYALASLMLAIVDPHAKDSSNNAENANQTTQINQQINYQQPMLLNQPTEQPAPVEEEKIEQSDVKDVDLDKAREEELALLQANNVEEINAEEENFIKEKQKDIEERITSKTQEEQEEQTEDEIDLDDIFVDSNNEEVEESQEEVEVEESQQSSEDEDIEALINKILAESEENDEEEVEEQPVETQEVEAIEEVVEESAQAEELAESEVNDEQDERIKALEEELARQKEEYESKLKDVENAKDKESNDRIEELERKLAEAEKQIQETDNKLPGATLSLEEYEARLEVLKERLAINEKEFRSVKKEYLPLAKIKKSYEKDKVKLRRKEALVAKQKVVLYGVNNYVDLDEEKAKKLSEDLDLLDGLRLSVQHCEEVLKQNEDRLPILENSYNILLSTNENLKADIAECVAKIEELKSEQE